MLKTENQSPAAAGSAGSTSAGSAGMNYPAALSAMAAAFPFPFANLGGLGGLRMLSAAQNPHTAFPGMLIRASGFGLPFMHPAARFPYATPPTLLHNQQQQMIQRHQQLHQHPQHPHQQQPQPQQQQQPNPPCGSAPAGLPQTPPTSPSLDDNSDLNKTGNLSSIWFHQNQFVIGQMYIGGLPISISLDHIRLENCDRIHANGIHLHVSTS